MCSLKQHATLHRGVIENGERPKNETSPKSRIATQKLE
jgi:hypothetical protein